jgi:hypothetical protein
MRGKLPYEPVMKKPCTPLSRRKFTTFLIPSSYISPDSVKEVINGGIIPEILLFIFCEKTLLSVIL